MLGAILLSSINLAYYQELMRGIRAAVETGMFEAFRQQTKEQWRRDKAAAE
jgi:queuine tRNA-ribosyltransferase